MSGQFFNVEDRQTVLGEDPNGRREREIGEMFVINLVELIPLNRFHQVRKLDRDNAVWLEQRLHAFNEIV